MRNLIIFFLSFLLCYHAYGGTSNKGSIHTIKPRDSDSLVPLKAIISNDTTLIFVNKFSLAADNADVAEDPVNELLDIESGIHGKSNSPRALSRLLRLMQVKKIMRHQKNRQRLFVDMAAASVKLRLYAFAMQCYYQSTTVKDSTTDENKLFTEDDLLQNINFINENNEIEKPLIKPSIPAEASDIEQTFNDGKSMLACAVLLHVKQPSPGKRKAFVGVNNVGHTFITLIKYNTDQSFVSRSFGFYPEKTDLFSATPFHPASFSVVKDDAFHAWDEVVGKFISFRRLQRILRLLNKFEGKKYDLNKNNCTDFSLCAAMISGIDVRDTKGSWPFGKGNNPACTGQSILQGKLKNTDTSNSDGLFQWNNNLAAAKKDNK